MAICRAASPQSCTSSAPPRWPLPTTTRPIARCGWRRYWRRSRGREEGRDMSQHNGNADSRLEVLEHIRSDSRFVLATHENMDGDALGSLVAMHGLLTALGKD